MEPITDASFITVRLRLKNLGQTAADDVYGEMDYDLGMPDPTGKGNAATERNFGSMGPGMERIVSIQSNRRNYRKWPVPSPRADSVYFFGTIWFIDDTTRQQHKEDWCYELRLLKDADLKRTDLDPCNILTYTSKEGRQPGE